MAQFSKQWCELHDPNMTWDFDIEQIANNLPTNSYKPIICDGFGFTAIGTSKEFGTLLYFKNGIGLNSPAATDMAEWLRLDEMLQKEKDEIQNNGNK